MSTGRIFRPGLGSLLFVAAIVLAGLPNSIIERICGPTAQIIPTASADEEKIGKAEIPSQDIAPIVSTIRIGIWNLRWLSDTYGKGVPGAEKGTTREREGFAEIASVISNSRVRLLGVMEVKNEAAVKLVLKELPPEMQSTYTCTIIDTRSAQDCAVIWDSSIVTVGAAFHIREKMTRPALGVAVTAGSFDGTFIIGHLNASKRSRRDQEILQIIRTVQGMLKLEGSDPDVIIGADWNDRPKNIGKVFATGAAETYTFIVPDGPTLPKSGRTVDFLVGTKDALEELLPGTVTAHDLPDENIQHGDHCLVTVELAIDQPKFRDRPCKESE